MNIFVLSTGRCGTVTFNKACEHIMNYTSSHESKAHLFGYKRFEFPDNHIEIDNRLSWFLGDLDKKYGDDAYYVHLVRKDAKVAKSFLKRWNYGIIQSYHNGIISGIHKNNEYDKFDVCLSYCKTVNNNINMFLKDKTKSIKINIDNPKDNFITFCNIIGANVDINKSISEFDVIYNQSK